MEIKENEIIVLENNERYIVLNSIPYEDNIYYFLMGIDENNDVISSKVDFVLEEREDNNLYIRKIKDEKTIKTLTKVLKSL
jgi:hypothetical protein